MTDLDLIRAAIHEAYGPPCDDFDPDCAGCKTWAAFGRLQWQPIETAPYETEVLTWWPGSSARKPVILINKRNSGKCLGKRNNWWFSKPDQQPTRWMPILEPSEQNGTKA